jgi:hypothetical protein
LKYNRILLFDGLNINSNNEKNSVIPKLDFNEDYYSVLEIEPTASSQELKKAYYAIVFTYHPDRKAVETEKELANKQMMDQCNLNYVMVDAIDELWELEDLTPLLNVEDLYFDDEFLEGLKTIVEHKYDIDDVLDKISRSSYQSLNVLNKHVLNKKSR